MKDRYVVDELVRLAGENERLRQASRAVPASGRRFRDVDAKMVDEGRKAVFGRCFYALPSSVGDGTVGYAEWLEVALISQPPYMSRDAFVAYFGDELRAAYDDLRSKAAGKELDGDGDD